MEWNMFCHWPDCSEKDQQYFESLNLNWFKVSIEQFEVREKNRARARRAGGLAIEVFTDAAAASEGEGIDYRAPFPRYRRIRSRIIRGNLGQGNSHASPAGANLSTKIHSGGCRACLGFKSASVSALGVSELEMDAPWGRAVFNVRPAANRDLSERNFKAGLAADLKSESERKVGEEYLDAMKSSRDLETKGTQHICSRPPRPRCAGTPSPPSTLPSSSQPVLQEPDALADVEVRDAGGHGEERAGGDIPLFSPPYVPQRAGALVRGVDAELVERVGTGREILRAREVKYCAGFRWRAGGFWTCRTQSLLWNRVSTNKMDITEKVRGGRLIPGFVHCRQHSPRVRTLPEYRFVGHGREKLFAMPGWHFHSAPPQCRRRQNNE
ncbi:hypothetical protein B0H11DRAFT_1941813 [Mycena galericulata]|nr:hypothetical protein B0H11DRAFT_1941813 [Mycena galericulata]